jgi:protein TonB
MTAAFFLVLPLIEAIAQQAPPDTTVRGLDIANLPPPPPPPPEEEKKEEEEKPEEKPPELVENHQPLDLSQLEMALNPSVGDGWVSADFAVRVDVVAAGASDDGMDGLFSLADLDQKPRVAYQPSPVIDAQVRKKSPGAVHILFIVDQRGRVENPIVQDSTDPIFEKPALNAVKQWKFEPGKRKGQPVRFRMRVPITFPKG